MKTVLRLLIRISVLCLIVTFSGEISFACTCVHDPLSKRFNRAQAVFIGKVAEDIPDAASDIQNNRDGLPVLEVMKSWKGIKKEFVAIDFDAFPKSSGTCPILYKFDRDTEYLIFAYGKDLKVEVECSDTRPLTASYDYTTREIGKLDSFWFRLSTKLRPF